MKDIPSVYQHPFDPDDSHYVNLPCDREASMIVSRDRHLLRLTDPLLKDAQDFRARFPMLRILDPVQLLRELEQCT